MGLIYFANESFFSGSSINMMPGRSEDIVMRLKSLLKTAGWLVMGSSDFFISSSTSTTFGTAAVDVLTNITSTFVGGLNSVAITGSMCNHGSWFVLQCNTSQSFCFQVDTAQSNGNKNGGNSTSWRIKYSSLGFNLSTATLTLTPRVTNVDDEFFIVGGGTDAVPTFSTYWVNGGTARTHMAADSGSAGTFAFYVSTFKANTTTQFTDNVLLYDGITTTGSGDPDPHILYHRTNDGASSDVWFRIIDNTGGFSGITVIGSGSSRQFCKASAMRYSTTETNETTTVPGNLGMNPFTATETQLPVIWAVDNVKTHTFGGLGGYKGISQMLTWLGSQRAASEVITVTGSDGAVDNRMTIGPAGNPTYFTYLSVPFSGTVVNI